VETESKEGGKTSNEFGGTHYLRRTRIYMMRR